MANICAPIAGVVWQVLVAQGDVVAEGDVVALIESMKLEIPVPAEGAGTVVAVSVAPGDVVNEDDTMIVLG